MTVDLEGEEMQFKKIINLISLLTLSLILGACDIDDLPLYRVKLKVHTSSKRYADTDDAVYVRLKSGASKYYLDYGRNDFEKNNAHTYDLVISGITELGDIEQLQIAKEGSDGLCIEKIELYINDDDLMFSQYFGNSNCHWLDNDNGHTRSITFDYDDLRSNSAWLVDAEKLGYPDTFSAEMMESMVESIIGNELKKTDFSDYVAGLNVKWGYKKGREYVSIWRKNSTTQNVDLDLKLTYTYENLFGNKKTAEFALDMDMEFKYACVSSALQMDIQNVDASASIEKGSFLVRLLWFIVPKSYIESMIDEAITSSGLVDDMSQNFGECPDAFNIDSSGNLDMDWPPFNLFDYL